MSFCWIVKITRKSIRIHYRIGNGDVEVLTNEGSAEIPLAFCLNGGELLMNRFASEQARLGSGYAFCDYFELIKNPYLNFRFAGEVKPIKQLLYYGLDAQFSNFLREKVFDSNTIESQRGTLPLRFLFADDISNEERQFVIDLFRVQEYKNVAEIQITEQLFSALMPGYTGSILTLSGIDGDLYADYYADAHSRPAHSKRMSGLGKDLRLSVCTDLMLEYINERYYNPFPSKEDVEDLLLKEAIQKYSNDGGPMLWGSIIGPDGETYEYELKRKDIEHKLNSLQGSNSIVTEVLYFLKGIGADTQNMAVVLLDDVNSDYFKSMLQPTFKSLVAPSEYYFKPVWEEVFRSVDFSMPAQLEYTKPQPPAPPPPPGRPVNLGQSSETKDSMSAPPLPPSRPVAPVQPPESKKPVSTPPPLPPPVQPLEPKGPESTPPLPPGPKRAAVPPLPPAKVTVPPPPFPTQRESVAPPPPPASTKNRMTPQPPPPPLGIGKKLTSIAGTLREKASSYSEIIDKIASFTNRNEAIAFLKELKEKNGWNDNSPMIKKTNDLINKLFRNK